MKKYLSFLIVLLLTLPGGAALDDKARSGELQRQQLVWVCATGDARRISRWCAGQVRRDIDRTRLTAETLTQKLNDPRLEQWCRMAHYFAALADKKNRAIPELKDRAFTQWLLDQPCLFEQLVFSGRASREAISVLHALWQTEKLDGTAFNLALGASLIADRHSPETCLARYRHYRDAYAKHRLYSQFDTLEPWEMALLLDGGDDLEDLAWGLDYIDQKNVPFDKAVKTFQSWIAYRRVNQNGVSIHQGASFYDHKPRTLEIYLEYGGVCGAVSTAACRFLKAKGVPGYTIGQPGHCAFVYKSTDGSWKIGNNIYGWQWSSGNPAPWDGPAALINTVARYRANGNAPQSGLCSQLAQLTTNQANRELLLREAVRIEPSNLSAWRAWLPLRASKAAEKDLMGIAEEIQRELGDDPFAVDALLSLLPLHGDHPSKYKLCSLLLCEKHPKASAVLYMRRFVQLARKDLPELNHKQFDYHAKTKDKWLEIWARYHQNNRAGFKNREQTIRVIELALDSMLAHEQLAVRFLTLYETLLDQWRDPQLSAAALSFVQCKLEGEPRPGGITQTLARLKVKLGKVTR